MTLITLDQAINLLEDASAIVLVDEPGTPTIVYPSVNTNGKTEEFLSLTWGDEDGYEYSLKFNGSVNATVQIEDNCLLLIDSEGERSKIQILMPMDILSPVA